MDSPSRLLVKAAVLSLTDAVSKGDEEGSRRWCKGRHVTMDDVMDFYDRIMDPLNLPFFRSMEADADSPKILESAATPEDIRNAMLEQIRRYQNRQASHGDLSDPEE